MSQLHRKLRDSRHTSYFLHFARNYTSQGGEDGILEQLFSLIGINNNDAEGSPYCVDIGAWDGQHLSNTNNLIMKQGWSALLVEANTERYQEMCRLYENKTANVTCINQLVNFEGDDSLLQLLINHHVPYDFDFLCIDIDGADYHLWKSIGSFSTSSDNTYRPKVVCIEFNPSIANHIHYVQEANILVQEGSSLLALTELGQQMGYHLVAVTTFNAIFLRYDLMHFIPQGIFVYCPSTGQHSVANRINNLITDASDQEKYVSESDPLPMSVIPLVDLNSLHNESMVTDVFQTYQGELKLCGTRKLLWHKIGINVQQMQPIKNKLDRVYPFAPPLGATVSKLQTVPRHIREILRMVVVSKPTVTLAHSDDLKIVSHEKLQALEEQVSFAINQVRRSFDLSTFTNTSTRNSRDEGDDSTAATGVGKVPRSIASSILAQIGAILASKLIRRWEHKEFAATDLLGEKLLFRAIEESLLLVAKTFSDVGDQTAGDMKLTEGRPHARIVDSSGHDAERNVKIGTPLSSIGGKWPLRLKSQLSLPSELQLDAVDHLIRWYLAAYDYMEQLALLSDPHDHEKYLVINFASIRLCRNLFQCNLYRCVLNEELFDSTWSTGRNNSSACFNSEGVLAFWKALRWIRKSQEHLDILVLSASKRYDASSMMIQSRFGAMQLKVDRQYESWRATARKYGLFAYDEDRGTNSICRYTLQSRISSALLDKRSDTHTASKDIHGTPFLTFTVGVLTGMSVALWFLNSNRSSK